MDNWQAWATIASIRRNRERTRMLKANGNFKQSNSNCNFCNSNEYETYLLRDYIHWIKICAYCLFSIGPEERSKMFLEFHKFKFIQKSKVCCICSRSSRLGLNINMGVCDSNSLTSFMCKDCFVFKNYSIQDFEYTNLYLERKIRNKAIKKWTLHIMVWVVVILIWVFVILLVIDALKWNEEDYW